MELFPFRLILIFAQFGSDLVELLGPLHAEVVLVTSVQTFIHLLIIGLNKCQAHIVIGTHMQDNRNYHVLFGAFGELLPLGRRHGAGTNIASNCQLDRNEEQKSDHRDCFWWQHDCTLE